MSDVMDALDCLDVSNKVCWLTHEHDRKSPGNKRRHAMFTYRRVLPVV
jgi:hypothetical protein